MNAHRAVVFACLFLGALSSSCSPRQPSSACQIADDIFFLTLKAKAQYVSLNPKDMVGLSGDAITEMAKQKTKQIEDKISELRTQTPTLDRLSKHEAYVVDLLKRENANVDLSSCALRKIRIAVWLDEVISEEFMAAALSK